MTDTCKTIIDLLGCPCEKFDAAAGGRAIYRRFKMLERQGEAGGYTPLVVYATDALLEALEDALGETGAQTAADYHTRMLPLAQRINPGALLQSRFDQGIADTDQSQLLGGFATTRAVEGEENLCVGCRNSTREVLIAKFPTRSAWELPLWLPMGGYNDCPSPAEQAAVFRFWQEAYGAVPLTAGYDIWELRAARPPMQLLESEQLAMQQFAFDYDLVLQAGKGQDTIRALASALRGARAWYFWWG